MADLPARSWRHAANCKRAPMNIRIGDPTDPRVLTLLQEHLSNMARNSPPESVHALAPEVLLQADITFWCGWKESELLGCGALKDLGDNHGEIKSMITSSSHLREGVASGLLQHIIREARTRGYRRLSLETGSGGAFEPAHSLYTKHGFRICGPFGQYVADNFAVFMTIDLG